MEMEWDTNALKASVAHRLKFTALHLSERFDGALLVRLGDSRPWFDIRRGADVVRFESATYQRQDSFWCLWKGSSYGMVQQ